MTKRTLLSVVVSGVLLAQVACTSRQQQPSATVARFAESAGAPAPARETPPTPKAQQRMVIQTANLTVRVRSFDEALGTIRAFLDSTSGFLVSSQVNVQPNNARAGTVVLRVPSRSFSEAVERVKRLASRVESEAVQGNDVTEEYVDLSAQITNKKALEARYRQILGGAQTTKDVLEVEKSLAEVREEIDRLEGRTKYLADQVALSTISVYLREAEYDESADAESFSTKVVRGIREGVDGIGSVLEVLLTVLIAGVPVWVLLAVVVALFVRARRRRKLRAAG